MLSLPLHPSPAAPVLTRAGTEKPAGERALPIPSQSPRVACPLPAFCPRYQAPGHAAAPPSLAAGAPNPPLAKVGLCCPSLHSQPPPQQDRDLTAARRATFLGALPRAVPAPAPPAPAEVIQEGQEPRAGASAPGSAWAAVQAGQRAAGSLCGRAQDKERMRKHPARIEGETRDTCGSCLYFLSHLPPLNPARGKQTHLWWRAGTRGGREGRGAASSKSCPSCSILTPVLSWPNSRVSSHHMA